MEIHVEVWSKRLPDMKPIQTNDAYFVFVALDEKAKPTAVMPVKPVTSEEKEQYIQALKRRKRRIG